LLLYFVMFAGCLFFFSMKYLHIECHLAAETGTN
jgi:hypothetical protein